jgi:cell wall-associated NlpC family hydrolase
MALQSDQQQVLSAILRIGRQRGATAKEIKAAIETGLVESGLRNLRGGDADSAGWRQERASLYKDPTNLHASINRFFDETAAVRGKYGRAGELAAAVQRPAAQYRGRYQAVEAQADQLRGGRGAPSRRSSSSGGGGSSVDTTRTTTTTTPGVNNRAARASLVSAFLDQKSADPVSFALRARELRDIAPTSSTESETEHTPGTEPRRSASSDGSSPSSGGDLASFAKLRADAINAQGLPYKWGGGHGGQTKLSEPVPLDCSGAVSKVLGIDPRVADQFKTWGRPGDGGSKGVTVYSKPTHTLMKINGHFFGTSGSNPGGGAGWIPQENVSSEYLAGFTARHSDR